MPARCWRALCAMLILAGAGYLLLAASPPLDARHDGCAFSDTRTYEVYLDEADQALTRAALGRLKPLATKLRLPRLERDPAGRQTVEPYVPPTIAKAIAHIESAWAMADRNTPRGAYGPVLTSKSCAYGLMQVLSGMQPATRRRRPTPVQRTILKEHRSNILAGLRLLAEKWNFAGRNEWPYVGDRNPRAAENWYYALWAYYAFWPSQSPANPDYPWPRPDYNSRECRSSPAACTYSNYPYQELVLGVVRHPPVRGVQADGKPAYLWEPLPVKYPKRSLFFTGRRPRKPLWPPRNLPVVRRPTIDHTLTGIPTMGLSRRALQLQVSSGDPAVLFLPAVIIRKSGRGIVHPHLEVVLEGPTPEWLRWSLTSAIAPTKLLVGFTPALMKPGTHTARFTIASSVARGSPRSFELSVCVDACGVPPAPR